MNLSVRFVIAVTILLLAGCAEKHLINNKEYIGMVEKSFAERKILAVRRKTELFSVFDQSLSARQSEALKFLFAYMPLSDLADYNGDFFLANADIALRARDETEWGKGIPEEIFLHYVLPCRVNNENLDSFRIKYYDEIMGRIRNKTLPDAALEINHWCHEKVSYQPADIRTSAPMSTILSARGRCGEESTFTVAALRTAGIPARQVYTPRWAHTDDNHAWVEIWSEGKWHYMGACEPEPVLDRGWFTEPARRAMLIHTKSFGASIHPENPVTIHRDYTEVNNLSMYAVTKTIFVKVTDREGVPVQNADVEFQLYNYAEFYPLAVVPTDEKGISRFETGLGDLLIWAHNKDAFNYKKISVSETDTLTLKLDKLPGGTYDTDLDLNVPIVRSPLPGPSQALAAENLKRINEENSIRQLYVDSWIKPEDVRMLAIKLNIDTARATDIFARSMGNYKEIISFLSDTPDPLRTMAVDLLEILADKDLRDIKSSVLSDHLRNSSEPASLETAAGNKIFTEYVLNPRVANEMIVPWRGYFRKNLPSALLEGASKKPSLIAEYLEKNIKLDDEENYYMTPLSPVGVCELGVSDSFSRSICFVAICRSMGIPSRLEPGSNVPQYLMDSAWNDVYFSDQNRPSGKKGFLKLISSETKPVPEYYTQFTLARFENGRYNTLEYDYNKKITGFKDELPLSPGSYMLVTGNRLNDGRILTNIKFFDLSENEHRTIEVNLRKEVTIPVKYGSIDPKKITGLFPRSDLNIDKITARGVVIIWVEPDKEPSKHIFNDLPHLKEELDSWGGYFIFISDPSLKWGGFSKEELKKLPVRTLCAQDNGLLKEVLKSGDMSDMRLPYLVMAGKDGNILFTSSGYRIGIGEEILRYAR